jgi:hypothetical protein
MSTSPVQGRPERRTLWTAPWWMSAADLRVACRLPVGARLVFLGVIAVLVVGLQFVPGEAMLPALVVYLGLVVLTLVGFRAYALGRRRQAGLVQVTPSEFDMLCALTQAPPDRIAEARELQHRWVAARRAAGGPDATTAQLEAHIPALFAAPSSSGFAPQE